MSIPPLISQDFAPCLTHLQVGNVYDKEAVRFELGKRRMKNSVIYGDARVPHRVHKFKPLKSYNGGSTTLSNKEIKKLGNHPDRSSG